MSYYVGYVEDHATDYGALDSEMPNILEAFTLAQTRMPRACEWCQCALPLSGNARMV